MSDPADNIVLHYLRRISEAQDAMRDDIHEIKERLGMFYGSIVHEPA